jgi:hypothetical protein
MGGYNGSGGRKACSGLLPGCEGGYGPPTVRRGFTGPSMPPHVGHGHPVAEHNRSCFAIRDGRRSKAKDVVAVLAKLTSLYPSSGGSDPG